MGDRVWSTLEDELLIALGGAGLKWQVVANKLGRTEAATIGRAGTLQLRQITPEKK